MSARAVEQQWTDWMRASLAGDDAAYRMLLSSLAPALRVAMRGDARRAGLGPAEVEDIVQETLIAIHLKRHTWDPEKPVAPWVTVIARHKVFDALRRRGRRAEAPIEDFIEVLPADPEPDPFEGEDVERMLDHLGARQRDIVRSLSVEGASVRETAARLGMSEGAVRVALHRGLKALAAIYRKAIE